MTSPNSTFTEIVTTTLREHPDMLSDAVSNHNALWGRLKEKGKIVKLDGGYEIVEPLMYAENSTYQRYSGYEILNVQASDVLTAAKYDWKQAAVNVTSSGLELRKNSGKNQLIDLALARLNVAKLTFVNNINSDLHSDGTANSSKQIGGLQSILTTDGTGTVGGIDASTYTFWKNQFTDGNAATKDTIKSKMKALWLLCERGPDKPDLILSSTDLFTLYWDSLTDLQRFTDAKDGNTGFTSMKFMTADVVHETSASGIPANHMYFLNTEYLSVKVHSDANMTVASKKFATNQDAEVIPLLFMGNLTCSNRARQGLLFD